MFAIFKTNLFFKNKLIRTNLIISVLLNLFLVSWLYIKMTPQVEPIALRYSVYFGIDLIGDWWHIFYLPLIGFIISLLNFILAYFVFLKTKILSFLLALTANATQIILIIACIIILLLNN